MKDETISCRIDPDTYKKLKYEPRKNRRFNNMSEILRTLVFLYFNDPRVSAVVHRAMPSHFPGLVEIDEL
jgi:hypothetical protein